MKEYKICMWRHRVEAKKTWDKKQVDIKNILRMGYNDV
jgi:hypothetical protein